MCGTDRLYVNMALECITYMKWNNCWRILNVFHKANCLARS